MKRLFFTLAIMFGLTTAVSAQDTGKVWVGGSVGFKTSKVTDGNRHTNYNITPEVGYMVSDNWGVGIKLGYAHKEFDSSLLTKEKADGFTVNPFVRYSFLKGDIGGLFVDGGAGYTYSKLKSSDVKAHELEVGFRPGVAINVSKNVSLTGKFGFLGYEYEKVGSTKTNSFGFDFDLDQIQLGMILVF
ncbi:porin family protein [Dysgonomonas sp. Marseille-P4677]|uniref:porin family protein n=1 Tax=Dysgonomonas sp. Marseille-P4677 TaxID=2364790 RepID=UPI0019129624|nr:porin family protein [Dysgonomonas sp. Marseille-P4677]MBK5721258.1 porin family protein [Dysgonomonas sp. Marseille-P4677]